MAEKLLIVESPTKTKTLKRYLGSEFDIMATIGHIKDLPEDRLGVDIDNGFRPEYVVIKGKEKVIRELKKAAKKAEEIYLGPDPDREGEAIAWHVAEEVNKGKGADKKKIYRVLFNEITKRAVKESLSSPDQLNRDRFESQMARRILDRLVGYQISPLLWKKVRRGLSAGRVQSVALRMICEREKEIFSFRPEEYWTLEAVLRDEKGTTFKARLFKYKNEKVRLKNEQQVKDILLSIEKEKFQVVGITKRKKRRNPLPPFTTSLMQQEAYKKLGFPAKKTMFIAQNLYEGIELGEMGQTGLITYMRTDSFRISAEAVSMARDFISKRFGSEYVPSTPNRFKSKKGAQEAHEAIRPTLVELEPDKIAKYLTKDQLSLYRLIWNRFLASQMSPAIMEQTQADIKAGNAIFRATGSAVVFDGFSVLYQEEEGDQEGNIPSLKKNQLLYVVEFKPGQHFTQPPPRYTDATLIKDLEKHGIGRPSTYATILETINNREYVIRDKKKRFKPTELGFLITELLKKNFPDILDMGFTARMEGYLDKIEQGKARWNEVIKRFYKRFSQELKMAEKEMKGELPTELSCPECGSELLIRSGKNGLFLSCSRFPECRYTSNFRRDEMGRIVIEEDKEEKTDEICELCGRFMVIKKGKFGPFLACSGYPECRNTKKLKEKGVIDTGISCPEKECEGTLVERVTKKGKSFYACSKYPKCEFAMWDEPFDGICPMCGTKVLKIKRYKDGETIILCRNKECDYKTSPA